MIIGVILAGGLARRMGGGDKALIELDGLTLLDRAIERLTPQVDAVVLNANGDAGRFPTELPIIPDPDDDHAGPLAGVLAGMDYAAGKSASHIVSVAVDTPFFPVDLVTRLQIGTEAQGAPLACAMTGDRTHPVFGLWPVSLRTDLRNAMADGLRKVDRWTGKHGCAHVAFDAVPFDPFFNINTPEDLIEAERIAGML